MLRGLAALAVCAGHLRAFLLVDFGEVGSPGILDRLFYFATGLGHQAVLVFFVLSGYLVGGSVLTAYQSRRWSWTNYALRRMTRLWTVLLPALVLTLILDSLGRYWGQEGYRGALNSLYGSGPTLEAPADLRATVFLGNAVFLQTIHVRCFGTNGPLWSLANEFWYYAIFPLLCGAIFVRSFSLRVLYVILAGALIWWLPSGLVWSGLIWLLGVGSFWAGRFEFLRKIWRHPVWLFATGIFSIGSLVVSKTGSMLGSDWVIGIAFALWIVGMSCTDHSVLWIKTLASRLSEMSYTLYLVHFPMLAFVFFCFFKGRQFQPGPVTYFLFFTLLVGSVAFAGAMWWSFERNTDKVRKRIETACVGQNRMGNMERREALKN
jgi:peptidoglycan/LPS O-acetylase OafA/YrhL